MTEFLSYFWVKQQLVQLLLLLDQHKFLFQIQDGQDAYLLQQKKYFFRIERQSKFSAFIKNLFQVLKMILITFGKHHNIIQVDDDKLNPLSCKINVHFSLGGSSCLDQSEGHFFIHKHSPRSGEHCLLLVFLVNNDLIITRKAINHRKILGSHYPLKYMVHFRQWVVIFQGILIKVPKIHTDPDFSIFLEDRYYVSYLIRES